MRLILLVLLLVAAPVSAQPGQRANCHGVLQSTLASGNEHPHLASCAAQVIPELAAAVRGASAERDAGILAVLHRLAFVIRDPALFEAGLLLAQAEDAEPAARVLGFSVALTQADPVLTFQGTGAERPFQGPLSENCAEASFLMEAADYWVDNGPPGPTASTRLRTTANAVAHGDAEPLMVRRFARCVALVLPTEDEPSTAIPDWVDDAN